MPYKEILLHLPSLTLFSSQSGSCPVTYNASHDNNDESSTLYFLRVPRYIDMTDIAYCLAPRYIVSRKLIRYRHIETVSFQSLCVWFYDRISSPYIIMRCSRSLFSKRFTHAYIYVDSLYQHPVFQDQLRYTEYKARKCRLFMQIWHDRYM